MTTDTFEIEGIRLLDVPHARDLARECITEDFYELRSLEGKWSVLDLGACFGELSIWASSLGHEVLGIDPSVYSGKVITRNLENYIKRFNDTTGGLSKFELKIWTAKVGPGHGFKEDGVHYFWDKHPAGSGPKREDSIMEKAHEFGIQRLLWCCSIDLPKFVKMDIEGDEVALFKDPSWLKDVQAISMETHNHDSDYFGDILKEHGFKVKLTGTCPLPYPVWDKSMTAGRVIARR